MWDGVGFCIIQVSSHPEGVSELSEMRNHERHTRPHRVGGVAGGVMHSVRYWIDDAVSINSAPSVSLLLCQRYCADEVWSLGFCGAMREPA